LAADQMLRDGIEHFVVPACLRQRFGLPMRALTRDTRVSDEYAAELDAVRDIVALVCERTGIALPELEADGLALLMRAAFIRGSQEHTRDVIVVCPSGMATAQLLLARLHAYFPRFNRCRVVSVRELSKEDLTPEQLIIATIPLPDEIRQRARVIQVHPLLLPADVERITRALA
jgi:mannitol operon transcriptional antiterminator